MKRDKIRNNDLKDLGIREPELLRSYGRAARELQRRKRMKKDEIMALFGEFLCGSVSPHEYPELSGLDEIRPMHQQTGPEYSPPVRLLEKPLDFTVYGKDQIEEEALGQMRTAMKLPVTVAGSLMPDAHAGYGLPIGGVLATEANIVIPYAVGVDIACRMCLTLFNLPASRIDQLHHKLVSLLQKHTVFGVGSECRDHVDDRVFDDPDWNSCRQIRQLKALAHRQLGTSGAGNHFVEWGILEVPPGSQLPGTGPVKYIGLLSHSGSRGFGNEIALHYSKLAMQHTRLPDEAKHLAWLNLESEEGQEYWTAMNLAGRYASACHREIHQKIIADSGFELATTVENHHNFAWKERISGNREVIVHRKGATPAGEHATGIIPGSMTEPGYVVKGKGNLTSLSSASHGAGRRMSRNQAIKQFNRRDLDEVLSRKGVTLIGGDIDEAPMAYKNIQWVMNEQSNLVEILARFSPVIVRMADPEKRRHRR